MKIRKIEKKRWLSFFIFLIYGLYVAGQDNIFGIGNGYIVDGEKIGGIYYTGAKLKLAKGYSFLVQRDDELLSALKKAKKGDVIYLDNRSTFDLTGCKNLQIQEGVTLVSDNSNGEGAKVIVRSGSNMPVFLITGNNVKISGIQFIGPDATGAQSGKNQKATKFSASRAAAFKERSKITGVSLETYEKMYASNPIKCIVAQGVNKISFEVSNCKFIGWTHAGIEIGKNSYGIIHHNFITGNNHYGLGYGVSVTYGTALIKANVFNDNRHSIQGRGTSGSGYEACYNLVGTTGASHAFDMHGGKDRMDGTNIAGAYVLIHHNEFRIKGRPICVRGTTEKESKIYNNLVNNKMKNSEQNFVFQRYSVGNMSVFNNKFVEGNVQIVKKITSPTYLK